MNKLTSALKAHWFFTVACCIIIGSLGVPISETDNNGIIRHINQSTWPTVKSGGRKKNVEIACIKERDMIQHNQNCIQFHKHFIKWRAWKNVTFNYLFIYFLNVNGRNILLQKNTIQ